MAADASAPPAFAFHDRFAAASPTKPAASSAAAGSSSLAASSSAPTLDFDFGDFTNFDSSAAFPAFSVAPALASSKAYAAPPPPSQPQPSPSVAALEAAVADAEEQEPDDGAAAAAADAERASRDAEQARQRAAAAQAAQAAQRAPVVPQQQPQQAPQQPAAAPSSSTDDPFSSANMYASPPRKSARPAPPSGPSGYNNGSPGAGPLPQPPRLNTAESHSSASMYSSDPAAPPAAALERMSISSARPAPPQPQPQPQRREPRPEQEERARPSSFFGMEQPTASVDAAGFRQPLSPGVLDAARPDQARGDAESAMSRSRPSSFFGVEAPAGSSRPGAAAEQNGAQSQAARIAAYHRGEAERSAAAGNGSAAGHGPAPSGNYSTLAGGTGNGPMPGPPSGRPASIAPTLNSGALLDHSHLRPGQQAALLSHNKTLELYRQNAKKTNDPNLIYELAVFMIDASKTMGGNDAASGGSGGSGSGSGGADGAPGKEESARDELVREAVGLLKKIAERGHPDAQYFLADCYANGIGSPKGKQDFDHAYPLFVLAAKHGHADAAYRAGTCYEKGWGCRKDAGKALQFYRKAAAQSHPGAMYRLATAELNGELGLKKSAREGVKWLKRSAEASTPEFPHALHELALLHERGIDNIVFVDPEYACELLAQAGEMGYAPSAYKLGVNYEYGRMGCPQDAGLSIHMYNIGECSVRRVSRRLLMPRLPQLRNKTTARRASRSRRGTSSARPASCRRATLRRTSGPRRPPSRAWPRPSTPSATSPR
jgi:TPR repeat protein